MNRKGMMPEEVAWGMAILVLVAGVYLYETRTIEVKNKLLEVQTRDAVEIESARLLSVMLQTPVFVEGHEIKLAELLAYQEVTSKYEELLNNALAVFSESTDFQLILQSGSNTAFQYGQPLSGEKAYTEKAQIPSFLGKNLVVIIRVVKK